MSHSVPNDAAIDYAIEVLNRALAEDQSAIRDLFNYEAPCNDALGNDPTVQVRSRSTGDGVAVTALGLINGLFGADDTGWGYITATYEIVDRHPALSGFHRTDKFRLKQGSV